MKQYRTISDTLFNNFDYKPRGKSKMKKRKKPNYKIPKTPKTSGVGWGH